MTSAICTAVAGEPNRLTARGMPPMTRPVTPPRGTVVPRGGMYVPPGQQEAVTNPYNTVQNTPWGSVFNLAGKAGENPENFPQDVRSNLWNVVRGNLQDLQKPTPPADVTAKNAAKGTAPGNPYQIGKQYGNLRYKGGDPQNETSWEPVTPGIQY